MIMCIRWQLADFSLLVWAIDAAALPARIDFSLAGGRV